MLKSLEPAIAELEAEASRHEAEAKRLRDGAAQLKMLANPSSVLALPPGLPGPQTSAPGAKRALRESEVSPRLAGGRTFKCKVCKQEKEASPRGALPKVCRPCKEKEAAEKH